MVRYTVFFSHVHKFGYGCMLYSRMTRISAFFILSFTIHISYMWPHIYHTPMSYTVDVGFCYPTSDNCTVRTKEAHSTFYRTQFSHNAPHSIFRTTSPFSLPAANLRLAQRRHMHFIRPIGLLQNPRPRPQMRHRKMYAYHIF